MLKNRSTSTTTTRVMSMADHQTSLPSSYTSPRTHTHTLTQASSVSSFMAAAASSPRIFNGFLSRTLSEPESAMSPTSTLDAKPFSNFVNNPFGHNDHHNHHNLFIKSHNFEKVNHGVGLAILENDDDAHLGNNKPSSKMVLFGAKLKVQIPPMTSSAAAAVESGGTPKSPGDFGIKTRTPAHLFCPTPSGFGSPLKSKISPHELALSEMELSEDYTCVITHGPNPKTTHIFDDCVVENCCGIVKLSDQSGKDFGFQNDDRSKEMPGSFLKVCDSCNKCLGHGKDVFMYRGEKAFCSHECRSQEMIAEGGKNLEED